MDGHAELIAGLEPSGPMLLRARGAAPRARLARGRAEQLPWRDATFDRVFCVNALHHFSDRAQFFAEARRVLKPGGGVMSSAGIRILCATNGGYTTTSKARARLIWLASRRCATLRGELTTAGFSWAESFEAHFIESVRRVADAFAAGVIDRAFTSQLTVLTDEEFALGVRVGIPAG